MSSIKGDVEFMPLTDVVAWIANRQLTCTLVSRRRGNTYEFVIRGGMVFQASSSDPREYLGQHLINFDYITETQLQQAFETQQETQVPLGRVLVMVDAVSDEQLARVLSFKIRESLLEAMCTEYGAFRVSNDVPETRDLDCDVPCDLREVHSEALARAQMWNEIRKIFPSNAVHCNVVDIPDDLLISAFDRKLLEHLKAGRSIGEACLELRSMDFQVYARLYELHNRKLVTARAHDDVPGPDGMLDIDEDMVLDVADEEDSDSIEIDVPEEAHDPGSAMRIALAGHNWSQALLIAERILERDPGDLEAKAAHRVAEVQLQKVADHARIEPQQADPAALHVDSVLDLAVPKAQLAQAHMTSKERYVLSRIDGRRTLRQIAAVSPVQQDELMRIVEGFLASQNVRMLS